MGRTIGSATARALVVVPVGRVAGVASTMFAVVSLGSVVTLVLSLSVGLSPSSLFAECCKMVGAATCVALKSICQALGRGMVIATFVAASVG